MRQLARIITDCGHRGKVGHIYEIIEKNPRDGFRLIMPGETQFTFWYPAECVEEVEPGACTTPDWKVPENADFGWHLDKVTESITDLLKEKNAAYGNITDLLKEKNAAYGNTALNPLGVFSKLGASEAIKARIDDKLARIANKGLNDDTEDTARDLVGYLLLLLMAVEREGR